MARAGAFDREGKYLASAHEDGTVKLWSAADGAPVKTWKGHTGPVCGVGFVPDGRTVVSAGSDGTVKLWDVPAK
jgi:WD40 repeat protein